MSHLLARKTSTSSLRRKPSESTSVASSTTPSDQKSREEKSTPYGNARYRTLETKDSFMKESKLGITDVSKSSYQTLLDAEQRVLDNSLFRDNLFKKICEKMQNRNEAMII
ncbi:hypothetical protein BDBG_06423 [Blastomyces gilchristii SLH14081]|uniref:Uncharacterized protein n=1 Tax=Blastomyces gilchristii (strain SLH14081) TaxID=559298 RepID=A0A179US50_BLAGS|nr:uncharacterized protein BDBG_06423 [Blastomyces gilchristii SLH14081]OAT10603.1 hypothetical protein BDBG_06423 [Blastomyces gilchristii SLH14081]